MPPAPAASDPIVEDARDVLTRRLAVGGFSLDDVARALAVSPRTLRRRLHAADTSYKALLDDVRRERAGHYLAHTDESLARVAELLGFADPSTFHRTFKRWTAMTPAEYRKRSRPT